MTAGNQAVAMASLSSVVDTFAARWLCCTIWCRQRERGAAGPKLHIPYAMLAGDVPLTLRA